MSTESIVVLDLDGVLLDFESAWRDCAEEALDRPTLQISDQYDLGERFGLSPREVAKVWTRFDRGNWWERVPPTEHAWELLDDLERMGLSIWAVTNVDLEHRAARSNSLDQMIPKNRIICLGEMATPKDRAKVLRGIKPMAFIDDLVENANAAIDHATVTVLLDRGFKRAEEPAFGVTVIGHLLDFPETFGNCLI